VETNLFVDARGNLGVFEFEELPFTPVRFFWIFGTPDGIGRAGHSHKKCSQFIFSQQGEIEISVTKPGGQMIAKTLGPGDSYFLPPMTWLDLVWFSQDSVLGVLASHKYDRNEYIESKLEFEKLTSLNNS
jgi:UDP-2-acetamido-3-amino-2,3-dideoxy-glucuronate N-acetyltransferase